MSCARLHDPGVDVANERRLAPQNAVARIGQVSAFEDEPRPSDAPRSSSEEETLTLKD